MLHAREWNRSAAAIADLDGLNRWYGDEIRAFGLTTHAAGILDADGGHTFLLLDWPREWLELYAARGYGAEDCTIALALSDPAPFTWSEARARLPGASERVFAAAAAFGWRDGLVVPVHRADGGRGLVVAAGPAGPLASADLGPAVTLSLIAFERALALRHCAESAGRRLTGRQRSALSFVAAGLTDDEIASAMGVSRATAAFHLQAARERLGARTRAHAVALALGFGLI